MYALCFLRQSLKTFIAAAVRRLWVGRHPSGEARPRTYPPTPTGSYLTARQSPGVADRSAPEAILLGIPAVTTPGALYQNQVELAYFLSCK